MYRPQQLMRLAFIAGVMPLFFTYIVYFFFVSAMTGDIYNPEKFISVYENGIFQYRVLGIGLLKFVAEAIGTYRLPETAPQLLIQFFPQTITDWFTAFFYVNLVMLSASMAVFFLVLENLRKDSPAFLTDMVLMVILLITMVSQYIIVPYDMLSYFFLAVAMYCMFNRPNTWLTVIVLCVTVALATLTRETSALILSLYAAVYFPKLIDRWSRQPGELHHMLTLVLITGTFIAVYVLLRILIQNEEPFFQGYRLETNLGSRMTLVGFFFFCAWVAFCLVYQEARGTVALYILAAMPYIAAISLIANPREIRLWIPLLITMIVLQYRGALLKPARRRA